MATNGGNIVVPVGVQLELQNVQEIIANLQKAMSNVKPETKGYSLITQELTKAERKAEGLASKLKQGFTTQSGIQNFTKGFEELIALVDTVNNKVGKVGFDNLILTPDQTAQMAAFAQQVQAAKDAYNAIETDKIQEAVKNSQELKANFDSLKINPDITTLDNAIKIIKDKVADLQKDIDNSERKAVNKETQAARRQAEMDQLAALKKSLKDGTLAQDFSQYFDKNGNFKSNGKQAFIRLLEQLGLDDATVDKVKSTAGSKIKEIQDEIDKALDAATKKKNRSRIDAQNAANEARADIAKSTKDKASFESSAKDLETIKNSQEIVDAKQQEQEAYRRTAEEQQKYQDQATKNAKGDIGADAANRLAEALQKVRDSGGAAAGALAELDQRTRNIDAIKRSVSMWMGFNQVVRLTKTTIRNIIKDIRELDKVMTQIAVVTKMTQSDLWAQMSTYQQMAKTYGVATSGVYQVSQIYYQQGLQTADVMALTNETLKMAKIAGLDYSKAADYMTVAIRGFKMEMTDAQNVVDVYSNLAAKSAVSTTELATAMSKTASSAAAVGSSFENTSAMIAMMVETTRESAENIGSALKSIISRYGEMKEDPTKLIDSEGEALSLNKVDKALQSIGISLQDAQGQFRDFDEVILELSSKWDTLDKNSQRYIATIMAGNRQQSRFLALVSDYDRLSELYDEAANSEDAALAQTLKTMDSLETKIQNVKNAFQGFYANLGLEEVFKGALDVITNVVNRLNSMPKLFDKIPVAAIGMVSNIIKVIKSLGLVLIAQMSATWTQIKNIISNNIAEGGEDGAKRAQDAINRINGKGQTTGKSKAGYAAGLALSTLGAAASTYALTMKNGTAEENTMRGWIQIGGAAASAAGAFASSLALIPGPAGIVVGAISAITTALPGLIAGIADINNAEKIAISAAREAAEEANKNALLAKSEAKNLENTIDKLKKLNDAKHESNEAYQEWLDYVNQVATEYPQLIDYYDAEGNAVLDTAEAYQLLAQSRANASKEALKARQAELSSKKLERDYITSVFEKSKQMQTIVGAGDRENTANTLRNLTGQMEYDVKTGSIKLNLGDMGYTDDLSRYLDVEEGTYSNGFGNIKMKADALDNFLNDYAEGKFEGATNELVAIVDLFYDSLIEPMKDMDFANGTRFDNEVMQGLLNTISKMQDLSIDEQQVKIAEVYVDALLDIQRYARKNAEDEAELARLNEQLAQSENDYTTVLEERINAAKENNASDEEIIKLTDLQGDKFIQSLYTYLASQAEDTGEDYIETLNNFYHSIDEETYKQAQAILAHPEKYASTSDMKNDLEKILGENVAERLWDFIITETKDGASYLSNIWEKQNQNLQNKFTTNITGSKEGKNETIQAAADKIKSIGDNITEFFGVAQPEIAADYLNNINKQWSELVSKQKNEIVATNNANFLADTYFDIGLMSKNVKDIMTSLFTSAELTTREGIQDLIDKIKSYQSDAELTDFETTTITNILENLQNQKENLLLNLNTEFQSYIDGLSTSIENINKNYNYQSSGFDKLEDMNNLLQQINAKKLSVDEQVNFDDIFTFNKTLGKYIFTLKGLQEANNIVLQDLEDKYNDATDQLEKQMHIMQFVSNSSKFKKANKEEQVKLLKINADVSRDLGEEETAALYEQLAIDFEKSEKEWDDFYKEHQKELENLQISTEQELEAAKNMTESARQRATTQALDFSGIAKSEKTFAEVQQSILNYFDAQGLIFNNDDAALAEAKRWFNRMKGGGLEAAELYKADTWDEGLFDPEVYNEILNQPVNAAKSLLDKLKNSTGQAEIQLTSAEQEILGVDSTSIGTDVLANSYEELITTLRAGVMSGTESLQTLNDAIAEQNQSLQEKNIEKAQALTSFLTAGNLTVEALSKLATSMETSLISNFDINTIRGVSRDENGNMIIESLTEFLDWFDHITVDKLNTDDIEEALSLSDQSKITDAAIQAENSIIENIASEINNIKNAGIDKKVNLTYLQNKIGDNSLTKIFGDAYQDGILTVTSAVKANMYNSLKSLRTILNQQGSDTTEIDKTLLDYINSAMSEISEFTGELTVSDDTAQVLAANSQVFKAELAAVGKITIHSAEEFARAANTIYNEVNNQFQRGLANLTQLNSSYANAVKSNLAKQSAGFTMLATASSFDISSLQNFLNVYDKKLSDYVDKMGNLTTNGAQAGLQSLGNGKYQIADWQKFISQLQITANQLSTEYIDAYVSWLQSEANVAPNAKEALMTSLIPNMEKLTYAQIGQIAKTFNATVDQILTIIGKEGNNGDGTFNGGNLIRLLNFDKTNEKFARALSTQLQSVTSNMTSAMITFVEAGTDGKRTDLDFSNLKNAISDFEKGMQALGQNVSVQNLVRALTEGGETAVAAAEQITALSGQELSASDIETLYRGQVSKLVNAIDTVVAQPGEIVDAVTASLIGFDNVNEIGETGQYVVETAANLYEAYNKLLQRLAATGEATLADLNNVAAKALENRDGEQEIIDALGDASSMTYTRFGEILAQQGIELTEQLVDSMTDAGIIKQLGGANMAITDFSKFADLMGWEADSEQYTSAFKSYNDSLIQMNRQAERNILEEAQSIAGAQGGDWIDLTQLWKTINGSLNEETFDGAKLNNILFELGGKIENGILKLDESADIPAIMQAVAQAAAESGGLLSNEMAQLADTVADAIKSYADLISGAIEGSLTNTQAEQLQDWANKNGVGQLDFKPTENGLKVATAQAQKLVAALKNVDSMQGKLTFDKLVESLSADKGGKFENISKTTAEIAKAQREIAENNQKIDFLQKDDAKTNANDIKALEEKNSKLREQISLYREIQEAQSMDPSQYNFMDRELPEQMQGPINYWNSVGQAFAAMNEAGQTGRMAIQDFYNIVNEMNNLMAISGDQIELAGIKLDGSAEAAAALIQKGMGALTNIDGKGVKVNLEALSIDFAAGADSAKSNFADGVHALADSQIAMLDAAIKVLEIVVAMEELGKVDVEGNNNGIIDLSEIFGEGLKFDPEKGFDENYSEAADALLKRAEGDKDLQDALEKVKVNGKSMYEMLDAARGTVDEQARKWKELNMSEQQYQAVINGFYQALMNGDYNLDSIQSSVWEILDKVMPDGTTIDVGDRTIIISGGTHTQINWKDENTQEVMKNFGSKIEDQKDGVTEAIQRYTSGKGTQVDAIIALAVNGKIKVTYKGKDNFEIEDEDGNLIDPKSEPGKEIIAKAALENAGIKDGERIPTDNGEIIVEGSMKVGKKTIKVSANGNGQVTYHSNILGKDFNSIDELLQAEYKEYTKQEKAAGFEVPPFEVWAYQEYGIRTNIKLSFVDENGNEIEVPSDDPLFQKNLGDLITKSQKSISDFVSENMQGENGEYWIEIPGFGKFKVNAPDEESAAAELEAQIREIYAPIANSVQQGITAAFTSVGEDGKNAVQTAISAAVAEGIKAAQNYTPSEEGESGQPVEIPMSGITVVPQKVDVKTEGLDLSNVAIQGAEGTTDVPIGSITLKPTGATLNMSEVSAESITVNGAVGDDGSSGGIPSNPVTLKPTGATIDISEITPEPIESIDATVEKANITEVKSASMGGGGLLNKAASALLGGKPIPIQTADGVIENLNIKSVTSATVDSSVTSQAESKVEPPKIPEMDGTVSNLNIKSVDGATVDSGATEEAASEVKPPKIDNLDGTVGTLKITEVSSGEYAAGEDAVAPKIPTLDATVSKLTVDATEVDVTSAAETIAQKLQEALDSNPVIPTVNAPESGEDNTNVGDGGLGGLTKAVSDLADAASNAFGPLNDAKTALSDVNSEKLVEASKATTDAKSAELVNASKATTDAKSAEMSVASKAITNTDSSKVTAATSAINGVNASPAQAAQGAINSISSAGAINAKSAINSIKAPGGLTTNFKISVSKAKGNMGGFAKVNGNMPALAGGRTKTLMGELGPELVVSNGRYFLVGQNGAEFVDLDNDAIVFNHLQTRRLFEQGAIGSRGKPFVSESAAVSLAKGRVPSNGPAKGGDPDAQGKEPPAPKKVKKNVSGRVSPTNYKIDWKGGHGRSAGGSWSGSLGFVEVSAAKGIANSGPAMASAAQALAALKQLRAMWESLRDASLADMGGMPGGGGGGGGGGGNNEETAKEVEGIVSNIERWYNWLALIEEKQNKINILTKEYDLLVARGRSSNEDLVKNLQEQAKNLQVQLDTARQLAIEQQGYRRTLADELNSGLFGAFYNVDRETGQIRLSNDEAFATFLRENTPKVQKSYSNEEAIPDYLKNYYKKTKSGKWILKNEKKAQEALENNLQLRNSLANEGKIIKGTTIKRKKSSEELAEEYENKKYKKEISKDKYNKLSAKDKRLYEEVKNKDKEVTGYKLRSDAKEQYEKLHKNEIKKVKLSQDIKSGYDFMNELFKTDKAGNAVHNAADQLAMIKAMGFFTEDLMAGVDTEQDGWEKQVVQNFKDKIENDKAEMEALNKSIQEQQEAALEYQKAIAEINNQIHEMVKPVDGVEAKLEEWYEWSRKIATSQNELNLLTKKYSLLLKQQGSQLKNQLTNLEAQAEKAKEMYYISLKEQEDLETKKQGYKTDIDNGIFKDWFEYDDKGNLIYSKEGTNQLFKEGLAKLENFEVTELKERVSKEDGSYLREYKDSKGNLKEIDQTYRDKQLKKIFGDNFDKITSEDFLRLQGSISEEDYNKLSDDLKKAYKKDKNGIYKITKAAREAQRVVDAYDNGVNLLDTSKKNVWGNFKDVKTVEDFIQEITKQENGRSSYTDRQQMEILEQMGFEEEMAKLAGFSSWATMSEKERIDAAQAYLEKIQEMPEEYNEVLDKINENKEALEDYKLQIAEINDQIHQLLEPVEGVTEHLESWYNWLRQAAAAQNEINKLTAKYNLIIKQSGQDNKKLLENLEKQRKENEKNQEAKRGEAAGLRTELETAKRNLPESAMADFYDYDEERGVVYKGQNLNIDTKKTANYEVQKYGDNGEEKRDIIYNDKTFSYTRSKLEERGKAIGLSDDEIQNLWDTAVVSREEKTLELAEVFKDVLANGITPQEFIETLTQTDANNNYVYSEQQQRAILEASGFQEKMAELYGKGSWDVLTDEQRNEAAKLFLETAKETPSAINDIVDSLANAETEEINLKNEWYEINDQIRDLLKPVNVLTGEYETQYNLLKEIEKIQSDLAISSKRLSNLQKDQIANGKEIYDEYIKEAQQSSSAVEKNVERKQNIARERAEAVERAKDSKAPIVYNAETGLATFSTEALPAIDTKVTYQRVRKNELGFEVDTSGNYRGRDGKLYDKEGNVVENGEFGALAYDTYTENYSANNIDFLSLLDEFSRKNINGTSVYSPELVYETFKKLGYEDLMKYDASGNQVYEDFGMLTETEMANAVEAGIARMYALADDINNKTKEMADIDASNLDSQAKVLEIQQALIDNQIAVENLVKDAVVQEHQDAIDTKKDLKDAIDKANKDLLDGLKDSLEEEKNVYESNERKQELKTLQKQLAIAERSGASLSKIQDLQDQVADKQKEMYFLERENAIDDLEKASERQIEALDTQISIMEASLDWLVKYGGIWEEVNQLIAGSPEALISYIDSHTPNNVSASELQRELSLKGIKEQVEIDSKYRKDADTALNDAIKSINTNLNVKVEVPSGGSNDEPPSTGTHSTEREEPTPTPPEPTPPEPTPSEPTPTEPTPSEPTPTPTEPTPPEPTPIEPTPTPTEPPPDSSTIQHERISGIHYISPTPPPLTPEQLWEKNNKNNFNEKEDIPGVRNIIDKAKELSKSYKDFTAFEAVKTIHDLYIAAIENGKSEMSIAKIWNDMSDKKFKENLIKKINEKYNRSIKFAKGGDIDFTGPAWVDGTKNKPEHIFNFEQMEALRAHLLNNVDVTRQAVNGLTNIVNNLPNMNTYNAINNTTDSGIVINTLDFHMEVKEMNNDYDARRAGQEVINEIVHIARKSGTRSLSRR